MYDNIRGIVTVGENLTTLFGIGCNGEITERSYYGPIANVIISDDKPIPIEGNNDDTREFSVQVLSSPALGERLLSEGPLPSNASGDVGPWGYFRLKFETESWVSEELCDLCLTSEPFEVEVTSDTINNVPYVEVSIMDLLCLEALKWKLVYLGITGPEVFMETSRIPLNKDQVLALHDKRDKIGEYVVTPIFNEAKEYMHLEL